MADDPDEGEDERAIELVAVSAIYPELIIDSSDPFSATINIPVEPAKPLVVLCPLLVGGDAPTGLPTPPDSNSRNGDSSEPSEPSETAETRSRPHVSADHAREAQELSYLPPVTLRVRFPSGYPSERPPHLKLATEIPWCPAAVLQELEDDAIRLWEEMGRSQMLFTYIDHLRDVAENGFNLITNSDTPLAVTRDLEIILLDFDIKAKRAVFEKATFDCGVCLEPKKGTACHRISRCGHVFCIECLQDFYNNCIIEGDVGSVKCIAPQCGHENDRTENTHPLSGSTQSRKKRDRTLEPSELLQIPLEQEIVQRYVKLKRKKALESDRTTVYCPRQWCQGPARSKRTEALDRGLDDDPEDDCHDPLAHDGTKLAEGSIPPAERLAICTECTFAFCRVCKASWHGEFVICDPKRKGELTAEEEASEEYIKLHTSPCPTCNARCQKTHGCNHMICFKCSTHFCYLCSSWLDSGNPYQHFNNPKQSCFLRLWELEAGDGDDVGRGFAGGVGGGIDNGHIIEDLDDTDSETDEEVEPPRAPAAPPVQQHRNPQAPNVAVRPPPARIQAAIQRRAAAAPMPPNNVAVHPAPLRPRAARPGPGNAHFHPRPPGLAGRRPIEGIQRFLDMAQNDEEDGWDSDELEEEDESDSDDGYWHIPFR